VTTTPQSHVRWTVVALLFFATTINYIDRAVFGILGKTLGDEFRWSEVEYSRIIMAFQLTYAVGYIFAGRLLDVIGVRRGFLLIVAAWSGAAMAHGLVSFVPHDARVMLGGVALALPVLAFGVVRAALGLAEGGSFPASIKAVTEWFPKEQRALATGLFNAGSNAGAIACPLLVPLLVAHWGWPGAFYATGAVGFVWLIAWWWLYRAPDRHPRVSATELSYIRKDPPDPAGKIPWLMLLRHRQTWVFVVGMAASAPIWWFYIFWGPKFLHAQFKLDLDASAIPLAVIFLGASFGGIGGGWLSSALLRRGWSLNASRKLALLVCALAVVPVFMVPLLPPPLQWVAVSLIGLAAAAHCGFAANLFTLVSDTMPRHVVGSVVGIGGMAGAVAAIFFAELTGQILKSGDGYQLLFALAALSYLAALLVMHVLLPKLAPLNWEDTPA
jgi:ACS family hexuronate transporter-like MFS transporter